MSNKIAPYNTLKLLKDQQSLDQLSSEAIQYIDEFMKSCPEEYAPALGALFFNMGLNIYAKSLGLPQTYNLLASTEQSFKNHLETLFEDFTGEVTFH